MFKWITASEINAWTEKEPRRAQELLPKLIIKLILSSSNRIKDFNFPSGKSIQYAGYDGYLNCLEQTNFFPEGQSVWEIGTDKNIQGKFEEDFKKRTENPLTINKPDTVFIFASSRIWYHKISIVEKISEAKGKSDWKDVKIIDANYLELWLECSPSVSNWLASEMGKKCNNYVNIEEYWGDIANTTYPKLNYDFFLQGREEIVGSILDWFSSNNRTLVLRSDTTMEALLVLSSIILSVNDTEHEKMNSDCLIVEDEESWNNVISFENKNIVLIPNFNPSTNFRFPESCRCILPVNKYFPESNNNEDIQRIDISKLRKDEYTLAMKKLGFDIEQISKYEMKTKRSFPALYRQITTIPTRQIPSWSDTLDVSKLIPALFVGSWDDRLEGDRKVIESLSGDNYSKYENILADWITIEDPPIIKVNHKYMIVSVSDTWNILWDKITLTDYETLLKCILDVFNIKNPKYELSEEKWFAASLYGKEHNYSNNFMEGIIITMVMLSERDNRENNFGSSSTKRDIDYIVKRVLDNVSDWQGWYTITPYLPLLVEASPGSVLIKLEEKALSSDKEFWRVFNQPKDIFTGRTFYTHLLWALEKLVWEPEYVVRAIKVIVLFEEKNFEYKLANTPINSLYNMFCLWYPQTCLSLEQRVSIIDSIVKKFPSTGWKLMKLLLPNSHQMTTNITKPRWRDVKTKTNNSIKYKDYYDAINSLIEMCIKYITPNIKQWDIIFSRINVFIKRIDEISVIFSEHCKEFSQEEKKNFSNEIGQVIYRHRKFPEADWSMAEEKLFKLEKLYYDVLPKGPIEFYHLFEYRPYHLNPTINDNNEGNYEKMKQKIFELRRRAIVETNNSYGMKGVLKIIENAEDINDLSIIITTDILNNMIDWEYIFEIKTKNNNVAGLIIFKLYNKKGFTYIKDSLDNLNEIQIGFIMCHLPVEERILDYIEGTSEIIQKIYWENIMVYNFKNDSIIDYVINKLLQHNRPYTLINAIAYSDYNNPENIIRILDKGLETYANIKKNGVSLNQSLLYNIVKLFEKLYIASTIDEERVAMLELSYLPVFDEGYNLKCLTNQLVKNPDLYFELMRLAYKKDNHDKELSEEKKALASRAFKIINKFTILPGYDSEKEIIDEKIFNDWLNKVFTLSTEFAYIRAYEICIGTLLSHSPIDDDGIWPKKCVREFMENNFTESLGKHFYIGRKNQRGVVFSTHGEEEKKLGYKYEEYADAIMFEYPKTASIIKKISQSYFLEAKHEQIREMKNFD